MRRFFFPLAIVSFAIVGCSPGGGATPVEPVSGGKSATVVLQAIAKTTEHARPSGTLGVFASLYLAQGFFLPTESATDGLSGILGIVREQEEPLSDESYALLQTLGETLAVDIVDMLNRSANRLESLDRYTASLTNTLTRTKGKIDELAAARTVLAAQKKDRRAQVSDLQRAQSAAVTAKDFATAGAKEQELSKARTALSQTEFTETQTKDLQSRFQKLLDIGNKRKEAIDKNREILLSGLTVTDLPGLTDLGLIQKK